MSAIKNIGVNIYVKKHLQLTLKYKRKTVKRNQI